MATTRSNKMVSLTHYKENLLQWVWQELQFACTDLKTTCGKPLVIINQGKVNNGAGPDFLHAVFLIGGVKWHGSVEIHKSSGEWYSHRHHEDANFNSVVLHVVYDEGTPPGVETADGHQPFTLNLREYIENPLHHLMKLKQLSGLACGASATFINQQAFERQIQKAHQEYFEYKLEEVLAFYPAGHGLARAWKHALISHCYVTLGISANSSAMKTLSGKLLVADAPPEEKEPFMAWVYKTAFENSPENGMEWVTSGIRPAAHPKKRVAQAAAIHYAIQNTPLSEFMKGPGYVFDQLKTGIKHAELPGKLLLELLFYLSVVPAHYLLGQLVHSNSLKQEARNLWMAGKQHLPASIRKKYERAGFTIKKEQNKLGAAHQYKRYCRLGGCKSCEVFKSLIGA